MIIASPQEPFPPGAHYEIWARGRLPCRAVRVQHDGANILQLAPPLRAEVSRCCEEMRLAGRKVEQNPMYHLLDRPYPGEGDEDRAELVLPTGVVDYEAYLGLNHLGGGIPPQVLAVAAATEIEGQLVLEQRGQTVAQGAGMLHVKPSGHMHPPQTPWQALLAETEEELGLKESDLEGVEWLGMVRSLAAPCVVLVYRMRARVTWAEMLSRQAIDAWEYERLLPLPLSPQSLEEWLLGNYASGSTGPGHATVLLEGWARYGEEWFSRVLGGLTCRS